MNISSTPKKNRIQLAQDHDYDIELWAWGPDYADPTAILAMFESDHPSNYSLWSSDEFDKLYNEANTTLAGDETARWDNLIKCNDIWHRRMQAAFRCSRLVLQHLQSLT